jgi:uncharacterized protein
MKRAALSACADMAAVHRMQARHGGGRRIAGRGATIRAMSQKKTLPAGVPGDLTDAEINELDDLLAAVPQPWEAVDAVMLDGYLCGVLVQPVALERDQWIPHIFSNADQPDQVFGPDTPGWHAAKHERLLALVERRIEALRVAIVEDGWFDPIVPAPEDEEGQPLKGKDAQQVLGFWVAGFEWALANLTALEDLGKEGVPDILDSIWRHLPEQDETQAAMTKALDEEHPLGSLDQALEALVFNVVDLFHIALEERLHVPTVKRDAPKVGRNDPCPCGSGKKFKQCHGKLA